MTNSQDLDSPLASEAKPASHVNARMAEVHCQFLLSELVDGGISLLFLNVDVWPLFSSS